MGELEDTASHLIVIGRGRVIADTAVARPARRGVRGASPDPDGTAHRGDDGAGQRRGGGRRHGPESVTVTGLDGERVTAVLSSAGLAFAELRRHRASLEEAYMELTRDAVMLPIDAAGHDGPVGRTDRQVHAEWTKLRSIRRWVLALAGAAMLAVMLSVFAASAAARTRTAPRPSSPVRTAIRWPTSSSSRTSASLATLTITARVATQADSDEVGDRRPHDQGRGTDQDPATPRSRSPRGHGIRLQADFTIDRPAGPVHWLRLSAAAGRSPGLVDGWPDLAVVEVFRTRACRQPSRPDCSSRRRRGHRRAGKPGARRREIDQRSAGRCSTRRDRRCPPRRGPEVSQGTAPGWSEPAGRRRG